MRKAGLYVALGLWIFISVKFISGVNAKNYSFTEVMGKSRINNIEGSIDAFGEYGITHMTDEEKMDLLGNIALSMGINNQYNLNTQTDGDTVTVVLTKNSKEAQVTIKLVTVTDTSNIIYEAKQYISINMKFLDGDKYLMSYKELIEKIFDQEGIDGNVNMCLIGNINTVLNYEQKEELANSLLKKLSATTVSASKSDDIFTIYGYTQEISNYIISAGKKVNVNVAITYDEEKNNTVIYLASPLNNLDY